MKKHGPFFILVLMFVSFLMLSCEKEMTEKESSLQPAGNFSTNELKAGESKYNLEVVLKGEGARNGHIQFRQNPDLAKVITLDVRVHHLLPNHEYLLQRAVDPTNVVDGNCTSTSWLTLGYGLTSQTILTNDKGNGSEVLWRDITAIPSGAMFDIHFRVVDAVSLEVVLTSNCYQYTVR
ncbi:hypothetical protein AAE02nite_19300 [Adhaeribacter aerolatus]|uniref:Uncharacterized protein n=1 Tax=Adhaeribacter aerolatus TaxID=670289 RepID=A0A512AX20_9BACT|nr:hypothetical protein [Adhaeribacter aerolatus]GEO04266.1 hypothetical protein AAE02nite_19300 [Adhaeribacter aerolatus]